MVSRKKPGSLRQTGERGGGGGGMISRKRIDARSEPAVKSAPIAQSGCFSIPTRHESFSFLFLARFVQSLNFVEGRSLKFFYIRKVAGTISLSMENKFLYSRLSSFRIQEFISRGDKSFCKKTV